MATIFETENFIVESHKEPEIDRLEGGHIKISPKFELEDRTGMSTKQAIEFIRLSIIAGKAFKIAMKKQGIEIGRINYQENGNWTPHFHLHLYGRAKSATKQNYGDPITPGHRKEYKPLNDKDISLIREEIKKLFKKEKYNDAEWGL